jgi:hypothetical protein
VPLFPIGTTTQLLATRRGLAAIPKLILASTVVVSAIDIMRAQSAGPRFEVASVRLNTSNERIRLRVRAVPDAGRLTITGLLVQEVIQSAYGLQTFQLVGNGSPVLKQRIDIVAKAPTPTTAADMCRCFARCSRNASS